MAFLFHWRAELATKKRITKIKDSSVRIPADVLDALFLNEGDSVAFIEENNRFYIRKTSRAEKPGEGPADDVPPPPTFEEQAKSAPALNSDMFEAVQNALKDPALMKQLQDIGKQVFGDMTKIFGDMGKMIDPNNPPKDSASKDSIPKKKKDGDLGKKKGADPDEEDDEEGEGYKIDID